jgi:hypothetical protein
MAINPEKHANLLLGLITPSELGPNEFVVTEDGEDWPLYKFIRAPSTIEELEPYSHIGKGNGGVLVWMDNGTLVYIRNWNKTLPPTKFKKNIELTSCCSITIYGDSDDAIIETAVFFGTLDSAFKEFHISLSTRMNIDIQRAQQMALILDKNQTKEITIFDSELNDAMCSVLATRPYPIDLYLEVFPAHTETFIRQLDSRKTLFGSLKILGTSETALTMLFHQINLFENLHVEQLSRSLILMLLSAPMKSIGFTLGAESGAMDLTTAEIVPKDISVRTVDNECPKIFMGSFLDRVAQLGHLESLKLALYTLQPIAAEIGRSLMSALRANKKLKALTLIASEIMMDDHIKALFEVLEQHEGLVTFRLFNYPRARDPQFTWLKQLMKRNRSLKVTDLYGNNWIHDDELDNIYAMSCFFRGSQKLTKDTTVTRQLLVSAAVLYSTSNDFPRTALLLANHIDRLFEILIETQDNDSFSNQRQE